MTRRHELVDHLALAIAQARGVEPHADLLELREPAIRITAVALTHRTPGMLDSRASFPGLILRPDSATAAL